MYVYRVIGALEHTQTHHPL